MVIFSSRPPPLILVIYADGDGEAYVRYLTTAGFRAAKVSRIPTHEIVARTLATMPDMIVLDYDCDGETVERLKADRRTAPIPVIALAELPGPPGRPGFSDCARPDPDRPSVVRE
jgi:hypothetical protein